MPKAEMKSILTCPSNRILLIYSILAIKLSNGAFSSMKDLITNENDPGETNTQKTVTPIEKNQSAKSIKPNKSTSNALSLKQALQNVS